jgi:hypothetical protein
MRGDVVTERKLRGARIAIRLIPPAVVLLCVAQFLAIGVSTTKLLEVTRSQGVETVSDLWRMSQAFDAGHSTFNRVEVRVIQHFQWIFFSLERLLIVSVFGLSMRPTLRDFLLLAEAGQHQSDP